MSQLLHNLDDLHAFAETVVSELVPQEEGATVVGLYGDLGSGKTTFTKEVAQILGVTDTLQSPTFVIMKNYRLSTGDYKLFVHIDAYRLEHSSELLNLGWKELISNPDNLIFIEWPERVTDIMPKHVKISFTHVSESERSVQIVY